MRGKGHMYDAVYSLGQWCATAICLKKLGLRSCSGPFDWMMGKDRAVGDYVQLLTTAFSGFFLKENMRKLREDPVEGTELWKDEKLGWEIRHEFRIGVPFEANYENFHALVRRRSERLFKSLRSGGRLLFVHWIGEGHCRRDEVVADMRRLRTAFPESAIDLLVIETEKFKVGVSYEEPEPGVVFAVGDFYDQDRFDPVQGNSRLSCAVLKRIHMRGRWRNIVYLHASSVRMRLRKLFGKGKRK